MKLAIFSTTLTFALVSARPYYVRGSTSQWEPPGRNDFRGPCPMMNTLANHGFLPHNGKNLTLETVIYALSTALNFNTSLATIMFEQALPANPIPNATFFTLDQLNRHNVLEHDASISRSDAYFGNNHIFNRSIFDQTKAYWTADIIDINMLANGKIARQLQSKASNPTYSFTSTMQQFSVGEMGAPILVFGDIEAGTVNKTLVEYFFENERLPTELGWTKKANVVQLEVIKLTQIISNATSLITTSKPIVVNRQDLHSGFSL